MIVTKTMIYIQGTNNLFLSVSPEWLQGTCFPLGKKPKPAVGPMVIIVLTVQWEQFDDMWQDVICKALSVWWWWWSEDAGEGSGSELTHGVGWGVDPCWGNCGGCPMEALLVLMQKWHMVILRNHWCSWTCLCCSLFLLFCACSQNLVVIDIFFPLFSAGLHCVQFLVDMVYTVSVIWDLLSQRFCSNAL